MLFGEIERTFSLFEHSPEIHTLIRLPALPFVEKDHSAVPLMAMSLFFVCEMSLAVRSSHASATRARMMPMVRG